MTKSIFYSVSVALSLICSGFIIFTSVARADDIPNRVYELRTYTAADGMLQPLKTRFRNHATRYLLKHGMQVVGYWTPIDDEKSSNTLITLLSHQSVEAAEEAWASFAADPEWQEIKQASTPDGPMVINTESRFMKATDFSPMK